MDGIPSWFIALIVIVVVGALLAVAINSMGDSFSTRRRTVLRRAPLVRETVVHRVAAEPLVAAPPVVAGGPMESRLNELESLRTRGLITPAEYETRRAAILDSL